MFQSKDVFVDTPEHLSKCTVNVFSSQQHLKATFAGNRSNSSIMVVGTGVLSSN